MPEACFFSPTPSESWEHSPGPNAPSAGRCWPICTTRQVRNHLDVEANWTEAWVDYLQTYAAECGVPQDWRDEAHDHIDSEFADAALWVEPVPGSRDGLQALADAGVRLGIVSNADGMVAQRLAVLEFCQVGPGIGVDIECVVTPSTVVGIEQESYGVPHRSVDQFDSDAKVVAVIGERHRGGIAAPATHLQWATGAGQCGAVDGEVIAPEADVVEVRVFVAHPDGAGHLLDQLEVRPVDGVAHGRREHDVLAALVAILDRIQVEHRTPSDPQLLGEVVRAASTSGTTMPTW